MSTYLFVLGSNTELSRAEIKPFCDEILFEPEVNLLLAENLRFENPRNLPKTKEQIFLDRLGGTIRMAKIIGEFKSKKELIEKIYKNVEPSENSTNVKIGISSFQTGRNFLPEFLGMVKNYFAGKKTPVRLENSGGQNMTSGQIFDRKLIKKGAEFIIWQRGDSFLLTKTMATQNLRNYVLRDRRKVFSDAKMGMLPPKLAQILINLSDSKFSTKIIDPFCGSGTICTEAAVMGFKTVGSDLNEEFLAGAKKNFRFFAEKFRYEQNKGDFFTGNIASFPWDKYADKVVATEGWLGENFDRSPDMDRIEKEAVKVIKMWVRAFNNMEKSGPQKIVFCLPCWNFKGKNISIAKKLFAKIMKSSYTPLALFANQETFIYKRENAFVAREICVLERQ